jgi:hypothetical protein
MGDALAEMGLDVKNLPPLEQIDPRTKRRLMKTFSESLGVPCVGCHAEGDLKADTRRKRVAKRMFNEIVRVVALEGGEPVYCDSCHQGAMFVLDRRDKEKVSDFMSDVMVDAMKRQDGQDHECETCHGDPPDFGFVAAWKSAPAPDIHPHEGMAPAATPSVAAPAPPTGDAPPAPPPAPKPKAAAGKPKLAACGDKKNLCPLQSWMRKNVSTAVAAKDTAALARALDRVATFSPDPSWSWAEMSVKAADAARRGDMAEARKSCQGCHNAYKAQWQEKFRTRAVR